MKMQEPILCAGTAEGLCIGISLHQKMRRIRWQCRGMQISIGALPACSERGHHGRAARMQMVQRSMQLAAQAKQLMWQSLAGRPQGSVLGLGVMAGANAGILSSIRDTDAYLLSVLIHIWV